jgi:hypothetical protein
MEETQVDGTSEEIKDPAAVLAALDRAKKDAKQFREEKEALETEITKFKDENAKFSSKLLKEKVIQELSKHYSGPSDRLLKFIKLDNLSLDEEFNLVGFDEQMEQIKTDFPEIFDPKLLVAGKADSADSKPVDKKMSASELQARAVLGRL